MQGPGTLLPTPSGADYDTPDGSWLDVWGFKYVLLYALHGPAVASETTLVVKLRENSVNGASGATDVPVGSITFTLAGDANTGKLIQVRVLSRKRYMGVVFNQTGGATGARAMATLFGVRSLYGGLIPLAQQPVNRGQVT